MRRRLQVKFHGQAATGLGFTENVSPTGMLVHSNVTCAPGHPVSGTLLVPGSGEVHFEAQVIWVRRATGPLAQLTKNSMGMRFTLPPDESFYRLLAKPDAP